MGAAEKQLQAIANAPQNWDIPSITDLKNSAGQLVAAMTSISGSLVWEGATADAARSAFEAMRENFARVEKASSDVIAIIGEANSARAAAVAAVDGLSSATVDPAIVAAARTASAIVFRGITLPADGAINAIEGILGNQREAEAEAAVKKLDSNLVDRRADLRAAVDGLSDYKSPVDVPAPAIPPATPIDYTPSAPAGGYPGGSGGSGGGAPVSGASTVPGTYTALPQPVTLPPSPATFTPMPGTVSVDGDISGTMPSSPISSLPGTAPHFPGGNANFGPGGSGGGGLGGGLIGSGTGTGLNAGLVGGGAAAAAAAARLRLGGSGGVGGSGVRGGISGLGGTNGAAARLGAGGLGGANGVGAGGTRVGGSGLAGAGGGLGGAHGAGVSGAGGTAGANGASGSRVGGSSGLLGSTGGGASGGNTNTVTSTTTGNPGSRGTGMMGGGGAGSDEKERRSGLGGIMAPKLDDEADAAPRSAGAAAGGRDPQPED